MAQLRTGNADSVNHHRVERFGAGRFFVLLFWLHQIVLGIPSMVFGVQLLTRKAEGNLDTLGFLLAWIGGTLCWGFAILVHERQRFPLPKTFPVKLRGGGGGEEDTSAKLDETRFDRTYRGFPYRQKVGRVEVLTAEGVQTYPNMNEFRRAVD